ncbi:T9SS type A sorting domain-containing protein [Kaistella palustris]|uniref:T9SS type A sorting domain-containing protein n=1 Tax=Kaistella palustris TaxID=493376 RepID=UPI000417F0A9|nr:T9SS type A sorting domain-containing protein [Kaistella palustris]
MKKIFLLFTLISSFLMVAQTAPSIQWQKSLGGTSRDTAKSILQTLDGGYILAGYSQSNDGDVSGNHGGWDYWIVKLDQSGNVQWQKSLGGGQSDYAQSVQQSADGGYIVVGYSESNDGDVSGNHGDYDYWIVKLDSSGNIQWQKSLGGSYEDFAKSVQQTADGGYIVGGYSQSNDGDITGHYGNYDYWIVKLDSSGNIQWQKSLGGTGEDRANSVRQTTDGGYIIGGYSRSVDGNVSGNHGDYDYWVVKLNSIGNVQWQKSFGGSSIDIATSVQQTTDSGYIIAGYSSSTDGDVSGHHGNGGVYPDYWIVKIDSNGTIQWEKSLGGMFGDFAYAIRQTNDGGYIVAGESWSSDGDVSGHKGSTSSSDYWIVKLNSIGNIQWEKSLGGYDNDIASCIQQTADDGYIVVGESISDDGDVSGHHGSTVYNDVWVVKLTAEGLATDETNITKINIYPNPVKDILNFSEEVLNVKITDVSGKTVKQISAKGKSIDISGLTKGVYIISATTKAGETVNKKIVKE